MGRSKRQTAKTSDNNCCRFKPPRRMSVVGRLGEFGNGRFWTSRSHSLNLADWPVSRKSSDRSGSTSARRGPINGGTLRLFGVGPGPANFGPSVSTVSFFGDNRTAGAGPVDFKSRLTSPGSHGHPAFGHLRG